MVWAGSALPLLLVFTVANAIWLAVLVKTGRASRPTKRMFVFVALAWIIAVIIDFWHH